METLEVARLVVLARDDGDNVNAETAVPLPCRSLS
jgi:hypothetical protein